MVQLAILSDELLHSPSDDKWMGVLLQMGLSYGLCDQIWTTNSKFAGKCPSTPSFLHGISKWLAREEGTGDLPRTRGTVLNALKKCHIDNEKVKRAEQMLMEN